MRGRPTGRPSPPTNEGSALELTQGVGGAFAGLGEHGLDGDACREEGCRGGRGEREGYE